MSLASLDIHIHVHLTLHPKHTHNLNFNLKLHAAFILEFSFNQKYSINIFHVKERRHMDLMFVDGLILGKEVCTIWDTLNLTSLRNMKTNVQWAMSLF